MVAVDRATAELRRGSFVLIEGRGAPGLAQAAELTTPESLAALAGIGDGSGCLALTAARAQALGFPVRGASAVTLPLSKVAGAEAIRRLADPTGGGPSPLGQPLDLRGVADDSGAAAAVTLSKLAQLLPAAVIAPVPAAARGDLAAFATRHDLLRVEADAIAGYVRLAATTLRPVSEARVPLAAAEDARVVGFRPADGSAEQFAILIGEPARHQPVLCRMHSECFTGDLLGSLRCDCGGQLRSALRRMGDAGHGVLLYLAHEGRGIGLINKLRAYQLQDGGLDTIDANQHLGFEPDERSFQAAAVMLHQLGITRVRLLTNNPDKVEAMREEGIEVVERVPHITSANFHNRVYLQTKARRAGHLLEQKAP